MFGLPLLISIFSPFFDYPILRHASRKVLGSFGMIAGTWITLMGLILVVVYYRLALREETEMTAGFGAEYENYMKQTPRFIPRFKTSN